MGSIMGSQNIMGSDYGSNISGVTPLDLICIGEQGDRVRNYHLSEEEKSEESGFGPSLVSLESEKKSELQMLTRQRWRYLVSLLPVGVAICKG